ncbi:hypothetical protein K3727_12510 [Rhodobacteraceae bacterium M382]|nr:hypothetical protein K3727_12510 [Rhodobacteraceae bacterium M382]
MKINSVEIISRATLRAATATRITALTGLVIAGYNIKIDSIPALGISVPDERITVTIFLAVIAFNVANLWVSWNDDRISYKVWASRFEQLPSTIDQLETHAKETTLHEIRLDLEQLVAEIQTEESKTAANENRIKHANDILKQFKQFVLSVDGLIKDAGKHYKDLKNPVKFHFVWWTFGIPFILAVAACVALIWQFGVVLPFSSEAHLAAEVPAPKLDQ